MSLACPRCRRKNEPVARYCGACGLALTQAVEGPLVAGQVRHPQAQPPPAGFVPVSGAPDLYFRAGAPGGGERLLGTEPIELAVFNGGYDLREVALLVEAAVDEGPVPLVEREIEYLPQGRREMLEVGSWELPDIVRDVRVRLVRAEFAAVR